jgi:phosphate transport system substrate-binding protein
MTDCVNPPPADRRTITAAAVIALGLLTLPAGAARAGELNLTETGSSLLYPLFNVWVAEYTKTHPGIHITTASTGSGAGIDQAVSGTVQIGASDGRARRSSMCRWRFRR